MPRSLRHHRPSAIAPIPDYFAHRDRSAPCGALRETHWRLLPAFPRAATKVLIDFARAAAPDSTWSTLRTRQSHPLNLRYPVAPSPNNKIPLTTFRRALPRARVLSPLSENLSVRTQSRPNANAPAQNPDLARCFS